MKIKKSVSILSFFLTLSLIAFISVSHSADELAVDIGGSGLWHYDGTSWTSVYSGDAENMTGWSNGLAVDLGVLGLWSYDGTTWTLLYGGDVQGMVGWSNGLAVDIGGLGLWSYDGTTWTMLYGGDVENMEDVDFEVITFETTFGGADDDYGYSVQQTTDGGLVITGGTSSYGAGNYDVYLIKTDADGNMLWEKTFGGADNDYGYSVQQTTDGGFVITGETDSYGAGGDDAYLIKTDADGDVQ